MTPINRAFEIAEANMARRGSLNGCGTVFRIFLRSSNRSPKKGALHGWINDYKEREKAGEVSTIVRGSTDLTAEKPYGAGSRPKRFRNRGKSKALPLDASRKFQKIPRSKLAENTKRFIQSAVNRNKPDGEDKK